MKPSYRIRHFPAFEDLPEPYRALLDGEIQRQGLFRHPEWFAYLMRNHYDDTDEFRIYGVETADTGRPLLLAPLRYTGHDVAVRQSRVIASISNPENFTTTALMFAPDLADPEPVLKALFRAFRAGPLEPGPRCFDVMRIWPLERDSALGNMVRQAMRDAGFEVQDYGNSFNRYEDTAGLSYEDYLASRSANMRYNIRRRSRALEKTGVLEIEIVTTPERLEQVVSDYLFVSVHSWKNPGSMVSPAILELMQLSARLGCLRLGILRLEGAPAAAQFWIVCGGVAHCARLAYHEGFKKLAVGVVLTSHMLTRMLDVDRVAKIDFGYGEDDYKSDWMRHARHYDGYIGFNRHTRLGRLYAVRHIHGRRMKSWIKRGLGRLGWKRFQAGAAAEDGAPDPD